MNSFVCLLATDALLLGTGLYSLGLCSGCVNVCVYEYRIHVTNSTQ